jgi:predicted Zn-dependent protease
MFLKYGRDDEREADDLGLRYMVRENYDPREMPQVFEVLRRVSEQQGGGRVPGWMSTHPTPENRIERIEAHLASLGDSSNRLVNRERYLKTIDDVTFGQNPREGYFRGNEFIHPELGFSIRFPQGWQMSNEKQAVGAISPRQDAIVVLSLAEGRSPQEAAQRFFSQQGVQQGQSLRANLGGLPAVANQFSANTQQGTLIGLVAFVEDRDRVYRIMGYTPQNSWRGNESAISSSLASFERVTDRRLLDVKPKRLDVVTVPAAMSLEEFARRYPSTVDLQTLAIINQANTDTRFPAGTEVKRVVGGEVPS